MVHTVKSSMSSLVRSSLSSLNKKELLDVQEYIRSLIAQKAREEYLLDILKEEKKFNSAKELIIWVNNNVYNPETRQSLISEGLNNKFTIRV
jgi:hypothetical protein